MATFFSPDRRQGWIRVRRRFPDALEEIKKAVQPGEGLNRQGQGDGP
jgi:hypothetical protein